jgi:Leucine-rich repeat (LRR) protein
MSSSSLTIYNSYNDNDVTKIEQYQETIYNFFTSRLFDIQSLMNGLYQFRYITELIINNNQHLDTLTPLNNLNHLEILNLDYCNLAHCDMRLILPELLSIRMNNCHLKSLPYFLTNSFWIKEIYAENNTIKNINYQFMGLPNLHILNLIGNNIYIMFLPPMVYSYYKIGLKPEVIDFIKDRKKLIAIEQEDRIIFS